MSLFPVSYRYPVATQQLKGPFILFLYIHGELAQGHTSDHFPVNDSSLCWLGISAQSSILQGNVAKWCPTGWRDTAQNIRGEYERLSPLLVRPAQSNLMKKHVRCRSGQSLSGEFGGLAHGKEGTGVAPKEQDCDSTGENCRVPCLVAQMMTCPLEMVGAGGERCVHLPVHPTGTYSMSENKKPGQANLDKEPWMPKIYTQPIFCCSSWETFLVTSQQLSHAETNRYRFWAKTCLY